MLSEVNPQELFSFQDAGAQLDQGVSAAKQWGTNNFNNLKNAW
jgi:hypothetical protein